MGGCNEEGGVRINEKPNQEVQEIKKVGDRWSSHGILNISQPYRLPWPTKGIALLFFTYYYFLSTSTSLNK
jgi:hypothetical protein